MENQLDEASSRNLIDALKKLEKVAGETLQLSEYFTFLENHI
jgi:hypothetical protein